MSAVRRWSRIKGRDAMSTYFLNHACNKAAEIAKDLTHVRGKGLKTVERQYEKKIAEYAEYVCYLRALGHAP